MLLFFSSELMKSCMVGIAKREIAMSYLALKHQQRKIRPLVYSPKKKKPSVNVYHDMSLSEMAEKLNFSTEHIRECLQYLNVNPNTIPKQDERIKDTALIGSVAALCGFRFQFVKRPDTDSVLESNNDHRDAYKRPLPKSKYPSHWVKRAPIVTIMGHVDHGKTTLLDCLRKSRIVDNEFGGITQHIGAFTVDLKDSQDKIVFIDTPGHAAFCSMRARGVQVTDLVLLVVAADDGVMPQTAECLKHIQEAQVPFMVAINKIDKHNADIKSTINSLLQYGVQLEECGGDIVGVKLSALKNENIDELLKSIVTIADLLDIRGDPTELAEATIIESRIDNVHGPLCTAIVNRGTLSPGSFIVSGTRCARVRNLLNEKNELLKKSVLAEPVQISGWNEVPECGSEILEVANKKRMESVVQYRMRRLIAQKEKDDNEAAEKARMKHLQKYRDELKKKRETGSVFRKVAVGPTHIADERKKPHLPIIVKADVIGSLEAIEDSLSTYVPELIDLELANSGIGDVSLSNVEHAAAVGAVVYAFNVNVRADAKRLAEKTSIPIQKHNVIYHLFNDIREQLNSRVTPIETEEVAGEAIVQQVFVIDEKKRQVCVAGCRCTSGKLNRHSLYKVVRNKNEIVHIGQLSSMKHFKDDVSIVEKGNDPFTFENGDIVVAYRLTFVKPEVQWFVSHELQEPK